MIPDEVRLWDEAEAFSDEWMALHRTIRRPEFVPYTEAEAVAGLIVPDYITVYEPDLTDPQGYYDRITVDDFSSMYPRQINGQWHGRVIERTELRWRPTAEWKPPQDLPADTVLRPGFWERLLRWGTS